MSGEGGGCLKQLQQALNERGRENGERRNSSSDVRSAETAAPARDSRFNVREGEEGGSPPLRSTPGKCENLLSFFSIFLHLNHAVRCLLMVFFQPFDVNLLEQKKVYFH